LRVWIPHGREQAGQALSAGDFVLIYECKTGRPGRDGSGQQIRYLPGRQGIVAIAEAEGPLRQDLASPRTQYDDGTELWWCWKAPLKAISKKGFVPRVHVNRVLGYQKNYTLRAFGDRQSGLKEITVAQYNALAAEFETS
jgi:hypothetical protein